MTDPSTTALTREQQQRAEAAAKAKDILRTPGFGTGFRVHAFEVIELAQFVLTGEVAPDVVDEDIDGIGSIPDHGPRLDIHPDDVQLDGTNKKGTNA